MAQLNNVAGETDFRHYKQLPCVQIKWSVNGARMCGNLETKRLFILETIRHWLQVVLRQYGLHTGSSRKTNVMWIDFDLQWKKNYTCIRNLWRRKAQAICGREY